MEKTGTFFSYFDKEKQYNGMSFEIIREMTEQEYDKEEVGNMYIVKLENGEEIQAYEEEIDGSYEKWFSERGITV